MGAEAAVAAGAVGVAAALAAANAVLEGMAAAARVAMEAVTAPAAVEAANTTHSQHIQHVGNGSWHSARRTNSGTCPPLHTLPGRRSPCSFLRCSGFGCRTIAHKVTAAPAADAAWPRKSCNRRTLAACSGPSWTQCHTTAHIAFGSRRCPRASAVASAQSKRCKACSDYPCSERWPNFHRTTRDMRVATAAIGR